MTKVLLRWRFFWSRRARGRTITALVFALLAFLAAAYLALPPDGQRLVADALITVTHAVGSLSPSTMFVVGVALCTLISVALIVTPSYRRHTYLSTSVSHIPSVSVYLDAENQLSERTIRPFTRFLMEHLDGRRADLLYFLDASQTANSDKYKELYRFGFRPVDVPHNPTGARSVKEAVDKELALHAFERALLGPAGQEFIIVTGDGDFVPLVYRLIALGHRVQVWAAPIRPAYRVLATYLDVNVIDLSQIIAELEIERTQVTEVPQETQVPQKKKRGSRGKKRGTQFHGPRIGNKRTSVPPRILAPALQLQPGEERLYYAVAETLAAHAMCFAQAPTDNERHIWWQSILASDLKPRMASVGYSIGNWREFWIEELVALRAFERVGNQVFPHRGETTAEDAARRLYAMTHATAMATPHTSSRRGDGVLHVSDIARMLASGTVPVDDIAAPLLRFLQQGPEWRPVHARYFIRCARALGLLEFDDVPGAPNLISHPRLTEPSTISVGRASGPLDLPTDSVASSGHSDVSRDTGDGNVNVDNEADAAPAVQIDSLALSPSDEADASHYE